jgi:hypothetical protein
VAAECSVEAINLTPREFEIIRQVTHQAPDCSESRLAALGCAPADLDFLIAALRSMSKGAEASSGVRIEFYDEAVLQQPAAQCAATRDISDATVCGCLPIRFRAQWGSVAKLVASAMSPVELYYRTGYQFDDILAALARLAEVGD